jgi:hypothetical protein
MPLSCALLRELPEETRRGVEVCIATRGSTNVSEDAPPVEMEFSRHLMGICRLVTRPAVDNTDDDKPVRNAKICDAARFHQYVLG